MTGKNKKQKRCPTELPKFRYGDKIKITAEANLKKGKELEGVYLYFFGKQEGIIRDVIQGANNTYVYHVEINEDGFKKTINFPEKNLEFM